MTADTGYRERFLIRDLARLCGVRVTTVHSWIEAGRLRDFERTSERGSYLIPRQEVVRILRIRGVEVPGLWMKRRPRPPKILVVESDEPIRRLLRLVVRRHRPDAKLREVSTVEEGIFLAARFEPDLLILEGSNPRAAITGEQAIRLIRAGRFHSRLPIIATATFEEAPRRLLLAGADAALLKPFCVDKLTELVARFLKPRRRSNQG